jgi:WD40 repeat protein
MFSPDGKLVVSASDDGSIKLWDINTPTTPDTPTPENHDSLVRSIGFSPDGKFVASEFEDTTIKFWDAATNMKVITIRGLRRTSHYGIGNL